MATLDEVILAHQKAIGAALTAAGITPTGLILDGWPSSDQLLKTTAAGGYVIGIEPNGVSSPVTHYEPILLSGDESVPVTAELSGATLAVAGTVGASPITIYVVDSARATPIVYTAPPGAITAEIAAALAGLVPGATASNATVALPFVPISVTISTQSQSELAIAQVSERLQITIWTETASLRSALYNTILSRIGTTIAHVLTCSNGEPCGTWYASGPRKVDESVADAMLKRADLYFDTTFDLTVPVATATIALPQARVQIARDDIVLSA